MMFPEMTPPLAENGNQPMRLWPITPYEWRFDFATVVSRNPESGRIQTRPGRSIDLMYATLNFPIRPIEHYGNLRAFCRTARGMSSRFTFADFNGTAASLTDPPLAPWPVNSDYGYAGAGAILCTYPNGTAAVGNGSAREFDLPFAYSTGAVVYVDGSAATHYAILTGTGEDGRDQVLFDGDGPYAPTAGQVITASCTLGRLMIYARLATDSFSAKTYVGGGGPIQPTLTIVQDVI